ncbi:hypothetical protein PaeBR_17720 [Paenibacillus sp. BR2-3]|uniref:hypothetical protein n=1 Tax=Paenibacillus sp. BR2-3 TaxID=3048494 RepID=UPI003977755E
MGRFLDMRISENSSTFGFPPGTGVVTAPTSIGVIGLQTQGVAGTGTNGLIVHLAGTVGVASTAVATVVLNVQRGAGAFGAGLVIYTADHFISVLTGANLISLTASDITAPAAAETVYQLFISATSLLGVVSRVGPENFVGIAQDGLAVTPIT